MQGAIVLVALLSAACSEPILNPQRLGTISKGPDSETIISGPDGSVITAAAAGGVVDTAPQAPPVVIVEEPEAEVLPVVVHSGTSFVQHDPFVVAPSVPVIHQVAKTLVAPALHEKTTTVVASNGLGSHASASITSSVGGVVTTHAKVSSVPTVVAQEVVHVAAPAPQVAVIATPVKQAVVLEEPAPIIPIPEPPAVEVKAADTALIGPSGTISTKGGSAAINGPASITVSNNGIVSEAIKVDAIPTIAVAPIRTVVESRPILTETVVVPTPKPVLFVEDIDSARVNLGPQRIITDTVGHHQETVVVSGHPAPIHEPSHEIVQNVQRYEVAQSYAPGPHPEFVASHQRSVAEEIRREQVLTATQPHYAHPAQQINVYQRHDGPNIPLHPPVNSVPAAILNRHAAYGTNVVARAPYL